MAVKKKKKNSPSEEYGSIKGMYRVQITDDGGLVVGDSGWRENLITQYGFNAFANLLMGANSTTTVGYMALGTGIAAVNGDTILQGEVTGSTKRQAVTSALASTASTASASFVGTFASSNNFLTAASTIDAIGLYMSSAGSNLFCGSTFTASPCSTNQSVNASYVLSFH